MRQYINKAILISSVLALSACGTLSDMTASTGPVSTSPAVSKALGIDLAGLEKQAMGLKTFEYTHNQSNYVTYLSAQPELIKVQDAEGSSKFFYKAGKLLAVQDKSGVYQFGANSEVLSVNAQGKAQEVGAEKKSALSAKGAKLYKMMSYNRADGSAANMKTGEQAKVNYLCIAKIQQVAGTQRVFRSPENAVVTASHIDATVRLNGNQYYKMNCQISANKVAKLSLMKK
ncbi:TPA: hypothetical protein QB352_000874 [Pasteurella multocida]|nr:hypothetical protein [Pasteurella multocida]